MSAPKVYTSIFENWGFSLAVDGRTDTEIARAFGVSERTLNRWKREHPPFGEALAAGKEQADAKVIRSLYQRAVGYACTETETVSERNAAGKMVVVRRRETVRVYPPDVMAAMYWLNNRMPDKFRKNPVPADTTDDTQQVVIYIPRNGREIAQDEAAQESGAPA